MPTADVVLENLECRYGDVVALNNFSLTIAPGEFVTLLGPSGSGKTSALRIVGGYLRQTAGSVRIRGREVTKLPPQRRNCGMVFQNYALFPHMRVRDNVAFGLKTRKLRGAEARDRVEEVLNLVHLGGMGKRYPHELSGGQQQRVALARAIAFQPDVLLMDEPLGALDVKLRESMQIEIRRIQQELGITTLYVTHDQQEAFSMSDRIVVMTNAEIVESGTPTELYFKPSKAFTAQFLGHMTVLPVQIVRWNGASGTVMLPGQGGLLEAVGKKIEHSQAFLSIRPEQVKVFPADPNAAVEDTHARKGRVTATRFFGVHTLLTVDIGDVHLQVLDPDHAFGVGDPVLLRWSPQDMRVLEGHATEVRE